MNIYSKKTYTTVKTKVNLLVSFLQTVEVFSVEYLHVWLTLNLWWSTSLHSYWTRRLTWRIKQKFTKLTFINLSVKGLAEFPLESRVPATPPWCNTVWSPHPTLCWYSPIHVWSVGIKVLLCPRLEGPGSFSCVGIVGCFFEVPTVGDAVSYPILDSLLLATPIRSGLQHDILLLVSGLSLLRLPELWFYIF